MVPFAFDMSALHFLCDVSFFGVDLELAVYIILIERTRINLPCSHGNQIHAMKRKLTKFDLSALTSQTA